MPRTTNPTQTLQQLPKKWAVIIVVALILYALLQPAANSRLGWHLPSLASLMGMEKPTEKPTEKASTKNNHPAVPKSTKEESTASKKTHKSTSRSLEGDDAVENNDLSVNFETQTETLANDSANEPEPDKSAATKTQPKKATPRNSEAEVETPRKAAVTNKTIDTANEAIKSDPNLKYGVLKDIGKEVYVSPAGLRYTRGSEEGHRLKHLERHLVDDPDRPGKHGVFDGDMAQALRWIDDAYTRGQQGAKGVRVREEDGRTVYEVPFSKPIGFIGGRDGRRDRNPEARKLRLVVDGDRVITAFPF